MAVELPSAKVMDGASRPTIAACSLPPLQQSTPIPSPQWVESREKRNCAKAPPMRLVAILWVAAMIALIVGLDVTPFKDRFWARLALNLGIVLVFGAFYFRFLRHP
jgi:hypothetical protein